MRSKTHIEDLIAKAKDRDKEAMGELYDTYISRIFRFVYFRVASREDAEDLTEQIFVKMFEHIGEYEQRGLPFEAWIFRIARNSVTDFYRTRKENRASLDEAINIADVQPGPEEKAERKLAYEEVRLAMTKLPEQYQEIIILKFIEEKDTEEISMILDKPVTHVRVLQGRALGKLRSVLHI